MSKHIVDQDHKSSKASRLKHYAGIERTHGEEGEHPAAKAAHRRASETDRKSRMKEFARIDRGKRA